MRVPLRFAFSRFMKLLQRVECKHGVFRALFDRNRDQLMQACPNFGTSLGIDGKKLHSHLNEFPRGSG